MSATVAHAMKARTNRARYLHPGAWWAWALGLAVAASRTTNPVLLVLIVAVAAYVVAARRPTAPWGASFGMFLRLGLLVIAVRMLFPIILGIPVGTTVLVPLPTLALPEWAAGMRVGGPVTLEGVLAAFYDGLRLATILACVGAANSLASPARLLKAVPAALYEVGVSIVVAVTFAPQLAADLRRVKSARRLRGRPSTGMRAAAGAAVPVLESALERSVTLAAAMDSRGYGRRVPGRGRRWSAVALLAGLVAALIGAYAVLDPAAPAMLGIPMLVLGVAACVAALALAGRDRGRTRYRPDAWGAAEWGVVGCAAVTSTAFVAASMTSGALASGLTTPTDPAAWPTLSPWLILAVLISVLPAWIAPPIPRVRASEVLAP